MCEAETRNKILYWYNISDTQIFSVSVSDGAAGFCVLVPSCYCVWQHHTTLYPGLLHSMEGKGSLETKHGDIMQNAGSKHASIIQYMADTQQRFMWGFTSFYEIIMFLLFLLSFQIEDS